MAVPRRAALRASDADREQIAERLREATAEGRLQAHELEQRLEASFSARTYGELDALVADLPRLPGERPRDLSWIRPALALALAIPVALAIVATVLLVITGVLATWMVWIALGWWFIGHRRRVSAARSARSLRAYGYWQSGRPGPPPGSWI